MSSEAAAYFPDALASAVERPASVRSELQSPEYPADNEQLHSKTTEPSAEAVAQKLEITDEELLEQVGCGAKEALGILFRRHARVVRTVAHRILRDESEAEDLLQEVFLFIFRKASLFDATRGSGRSWIVQATYHRAIDRRRYLISRRFYNHLELEDAAAGTAEPGIEVAFYERSLEGTLGKATLQQIEESLSIDQRTTLHLFFFEGHTIEEIAGLMGQSRGNIRNHYYRALEKMRKQIFATQLLPK